MNSNLNTLTVAALAAAAGFQARVEALRAALPAATIADTKACADALRPGVAKYYAITLNVAETGRTAFPKDHAQSAVARKSLSRLTAAVRGVVVKDSQEMEVPAELLKAAHVLAKLSGEYEGSRKLANAALAAAFAK